MGRLLAQQGDGLGEHGQLHHAVEEGVRTGEGREKGGGRCGSRLAMEGAAVGRGG